MRKVIQIAALRAIRKHEQYGQELTETEVVALCDDGTIWIKPVTDSAQDWVKVKPVPQDV